jgi:hypothetical protein
MLPEEVAAGPELFVLGATGAGLSEPEPEPGWEEAAAGVMLILVLGASVSAACGWGFGVDDGDGLDDSAPGFLGSSDLEDAGAGVGPPSLARRRARIYR